MIWHRIDDIGQGDQGIKIVKCKAHMTKAAIIIADSAQQEIPHVNIEADSWAKQGAGLDHPVEWHVQALSDQHKKIKGIMNYLAYIEVNTRDINGDRADAQRKGDTVKQKGDKRKRGRPRGSKPSERYYFEGQAWTPHKHAYDKGDKGDKNGRAV